MRLIDADVLVEVFQKEKEFLQKGLGKDAEYVYMSADCVIHKIKNLRSGHNELSDWSRMPKVEINGRKYVDMQIFVDLLDKKFEEEKANCDNSDEAVAIAICQNILLNVRI